MPKGDTDVRYKGYLIRWTGWKEAQDSLNLVGQWFTANRDGMILYSGTNGTNGVIAKGAILDISSKDMEFITPLSSAADREMKKQEALARIIVIIDSHDNYYPEDKAIPERSL